MTCKDTQQLYIGDDICLANVSEKLNFRLLVTPSDEMEGRQVPQGWCR